MLGKEVKNSKPEYINWLVTIVICIFFMISIWKYVNEKNIWISNAKNGIEQQKMVSVQKESDLNQITEPKKLALTFDDGPHPKYTPLLLEGLRKRNTKATFFVTGENAKEYPEIIMQMQKDGHLIGNHTYTHIQLTSGNLEKFKEELIRTNQVLCEITGQETIFVRPPYGAWDKRLEKDLNMIPVLWTVDPLDWCTCNEDEIITRVMQKVKESDIILLHDAYETSVNAAFSIIDAKKKDGYSFVTVDEILFD